MLLTSAAMKPSVVSCIKNNTCGSEIWTSNQKKITPCVDELFETSATLH
jgi:hypothetical protein